MSNNENIWIKRTAIEHQLGLKEKIDKKLLEKIIINSFGTDEFFINKAIRWALRDYSKTNPTWVKKFIICLSLLFIATVSVSIISIKLFISLSGL